MIKNFLKKINIDFIYKYGFTISLSLQLLLYFFVDNFFPATNIRFFVDSLLVFGIFTFFRRDFLKRANIFTILSLILVACYILGFIINFNNTNFVCLKNILIVLLMINIFSVIELNELQLKIINYACVACGVIIALIMLILRQDYFGTNRITIKLNVGFNGSQVDPNYLAAFLLIPFVLSVMNVIKDKNTYLKVLFAISACLIFISIVLTCSRGGLVGIGVFIIVFIIKNIKFNKKSLTYVGILFVIFVLLLLFVRFVTPFILPKTVSARLDFTKWFSISNFDARFEIWVNTFKVIKQKIFLGYGVNFASSITSKVLGVDMMASHNTFLEIWIQVGIIPILVLVGYFVVIFFNKKTKFSCSLMAGMYASCFFLSMQLSFTFWVAIGLSILIYKEEIKDDTAYKCDNTSL